MSYYFTYVIPITFYLLGEKVVLTALSMGKYTRVVTKLQGVLGDSVHQRNKTFPFTWTKSSKKSFVCVCLFYLLLSYKILSITKDMFNK